MQIKSLRTKSYRSWKIDDRAIPKIVKERENKIKLYNKLRAGGCNETTALAAIGMSRATYYRLNKRYKVQGVYGLVSNSKKPHKLRQRCWDNKLCALILQLRKANPIWGKEKVQRLLVREYNL